MGNSGTSAPLLNQKRHPLDDLFTWKLSVYGDEADKLIRKIAALSTGLETIEWWEEKIGWTTGPEGALSQAKVRYEEVLKRARDSGWHLSD